MLTFSDSSSDSSETEGPTELKADDEFLLTPLEESGDEDSESGSQVIALDTGSSAGSDAAPTMLGSGAGGGGGVAAMLDEDFAGAGAGLGVAAAGGAAAVAAPGDFAPRMPKAVCQWAAPRNIPASLRRLTTLFKITSLAICVVLLLLTGFMAFDMVRNMWSWNGPYSISSSMMDSIVNAVGW